MMLMWYIGRSTPFGLLDNWETSVVLVNGFGYEVER